MRAKSDLDKPRREPNVRVWAVAILAANLLSLSAYMPIRVEAAAPIATNFQKWTIGKDGVLRCSETDGKTLLKFRRGTPTYESERGPIPADYRSITFLIFDKGRSAAIFDYNNGSTTVTFHLGGCAPTQIHTYPKLEVYRYTHVLKSGAGLVAALSDVNIESSEDFENSGYIVQWDLNGAEKMRVGPHEIGRMYTEDIEMFGEERYGALHLKGREYLFFNFIKAKHHLYSWPGDGRGGKYEFTAYGTLQVFQIVGWKTKEGKIIPNDGSLKRLSPDEYDKVSRTIEPIYQLIHEYQF